MYRAAFKPPFLRLVTPFSYARLAVKFWPFYTSATLMMGSWLAANHYQPWVTAHSEFLAALALTAVSFGALVANRKLRVDAPTSARLLFTLALIPLLQTATSQVFFVGDAWIAALYLGATGVAVVASTRATVVVGPGFVAGFAMTLLAGAVLSTLVAFAQQFETDTGLLSLYIAQVRPGGRPFANLAQPNQLASLIGIGLGGLFLLFERRKLSAGVAVFVAVLLTVSLAMTQSRTAVLFFIVVGGALVLARRRLSLRTPAWVIGALAALWGAAFVAWPSLIRWLLLPQAESFSKRIQPGGRSLIWNQLREAAWQRPWTGYGWNQVSVAQVAVAADFPPTEFVEHSHNLVLDLLLWNGIPIGLAVIGVGVIWLWRRTRRARDAESLFGLFVIAVLLCHAMVEFPLDYLYFLVPFGAAIGVVEAFSGASTSSVSTRVGWIATSVVSGVTVFAAIDYWHVEESFRDMRFAVARIGRPMSGDEPTPLITQFTQLAAFRRFSLSMPRTAMSAEELESMRQIVHRYPYAPSLYRYALAQGLNRDLAGAKLTLRQLKQMHGEAPYANGQQELKQLAADQYPQLRALVSVDE